MMASASPVDPDHHSDYIGGVLSYILPEDLVISSQPSAFLHDILDESEEKGNLSVVIEEHLSDKVEILIHGLLDCVICPYVEDPKLQVPNSCHDVSNLGEASPYYKDW